MKQKKLAAKQKRLQNKYTRKTTFLKLLILHLTTFGKDRTNNKLDIAILGHLLKILQLASVKHRPPQSSEP